jgi:hypothetical protein
MMLTEFLLERIDEDCEVAYGGAPSPWSEGGSELFIATGQRQVLDKHGHLTALCYYGGTYGHVLRFDPTRVMAELEAKRQVVNLHPHHPAGPHPFDWSSCQIYFGGQCARAGNCMTCRTEGPCPTIRLLATPYAGHPEYLPEWAVQ